MSDEQKEITVLFEESKGTPPEQAADTSDDEFEVNITDDDDSSEEQLGDEGSDDGDFAPSK